MPEHGGAQQQYLDGLRAGSPVDRGYGGDHHVVGLAHGVAVQPDFLQPVDERAGQLHAVLAECLQERSHQRTLALDRPGRADGVLAELRAELHGLLDGAAEMERRPGARVGALSGLRAVRARGQEDAQAAPARGQFGEVDARHRGLEQPCGGGGLEDQACDRTSGGDEPCRGRHLLPGQGHPAGDGERGLVRGGPGQDQLPLGQMLEGGRLVAPPEPSGVELEAARRPGGEESAQFIDCQCHGYPCMWTHRHRLVRVTLGPLRVTNARLVAD
ncbi:hypothetical protein ACFCV9_00595 [Streptomyces sp. NPDC056367]|uniref:hypothetical protein n=1 Tax=Streptomyces sp. NPDC056367 TaxID=3345797 RepID=UPI0035DF2409